MSYPLCVRRSAGAFAATIGLLAATIPIAGAASQPASQSARQAIVGPYLGLKSYQATIHSLTTLQPKSGGAPNKIDATISVSYRAPNLLHVDIQGLMGGSTAVSDGSKMYLYSAMMNRYSTSPAPKNLSATVMSAVSSAPNLKPAGRATIDGRPMTEYISSGPSAGDHGSYTVFVDRSTRLIRRVVIRMSQLPGPQGGSFSMTTQQDYTAQRLNPHLAGDLFRFQPPSDAEKAASGSMPPMMGLPGMSER